MPEEFRKVVADLYSDLAFPPDQNPLWDLREAGLGVMSTPKVRKLAEFVTGTWAAKAGPKKSALVVSGEDVAYGLARLFEFNTGGPTTVRVFRDMKEAMTWLASED